MGDAGAADPRDRGDRLPAGDEVDGDRVGVGGQRQRRRLADLGLERLQVRPGQHAQVEAGQHVVGEGEQVRAEPVAAGVGDVFDVARVDERRERARDRAGVDPGQAGELGRAGVAAHAQEGVEDAQCPLDRCQAPLGGSSGGRHPRIIAEPAMHVHR
jgi:hypothetical protein